MKKGILAFSILLATFFLYKDVLFVIKPYKEPSLSSFLKNKKLKDSLSYKFTTATINSISEIYGFKSTPNKVALGIKYLNKDKSCWIKSVVDTPYLLFIGTTKKEGEVINIIYYKNGNCNDRKKAIYVSNKEDIREVKYIKLIKISALSLFIIFLIRGIFFKQKIEQKNSTITYYE
ncbi:hypothetical protein [uncultured Aquimarina sp.]|uniref:hypothetical protein n=1 Tax=uncultured Aquimarina sp. TaxID=575652 RepID=UPI00262B8737|nr:hypothetical protein [uncultured Aquimarina sp.]